MYIVNVLNGLRFALLLTVTFSHASSSRTCGPGQKLSKDRTRCLPCPHDFFMSESDHQHLQCMRCSQVIHGTYYRVKEPCTKTSDTKFGCEKGYYKQFTTTTGTEFDCIICTECAAIKKFHVRPCQNDENTVCCYEPGMVFEDGQCKHRKPGSTGSNTPDLDTLTSTEDSSNPTDELPMSSLPSGTGNENMQEISDSERWYQIIHDCSLYVLVVVLTILVVYREWRWRNKMEIVKSEYQDTAQLIQGQEATENNRGAEKTKLRPANTET